MAQPSVNLGVRRSIARKLSLLILTVLPVVLYVAVFLWMLTSVFIAPPPSSNSEGPFGARFLIGMVLVSFCIYGIMIWYLRDIVRNPGLDTAPKVIWAIVILQFGIVAMPVYWFLYVWRDAAPGGRPTTAGQITEAH